MLAEVEQCKADHPQAWKDAHTGNSRTDDFIKLLAARLYALNSAFGNNGKRGDPLDISDDAINFKGEGADYDPTAGNAPRTVIDVIGSAGTPGAFPQWIVVTNAANPVGAAWVKPGAVAPPVVVPPAPKPVYPDENTFWKAFQEQMRKAYSDAGRTFPDPNDADAFRRFSRCGFDIGTGMNADAAAAKHISELRKELGV